MTEHFLPEVRALLEATEALGLALYDADIESIDSALERRLTCFDAISALADQSPGAEVRTLLLQISALDRKIIAAASAVRGLAREQLEQLANARRAAIAFQSHHSDPTVDSTPRFIARTV